MYIDEIAAVLDNMAKGDLRIELKNKYEGEFAKLKDALFEISAGLTMVVSGFQESSNQVLSGSDELANVSQALAEGATMQTMAVETLLTTTNKIMEEVEEINQGISGNSAIAEEASATSQELATQAANLNDLIGNFKY